ncbi:hypothetical protein F5Y00DRAFT_258753 [Daldinia vernicosa]|uniref:uncharacterized protein n=1 Tax=Daldinia vernicosa TaxID=114800 RepID=UPI002007DFEF|nr:uncharacterized protein F5Y00DRAFT_258753 [Daldinia vernicosa]KAI0852346.1 hypothetical protein F5Y00DRAFT_258753 [Daldinia vernicosa]
MALIGPEVRQTYFDMALSMGDEDQVMATEVILGQGPHKGQLVAELGRAKGRKTVSRADLLKGFPALIPKEAISFGKKLVDVKEQVSGKPNVRLAFQDGTKIEVDCLLGADGINPKWTINVPVLLGPRDHINCIPLNKNTRLSAGVAVRGAFSTIDGCAPPLDPTLYADYSEEAQQIVPDHDHAPYYARGRVAMLGDAAHTAMPFAGNGAAQALEDAAVLDYLLAHVERPEQIEHALRAFDGVRRPRSQAVVELARKFGRVYAYAEDGMHEDPARMMEFFGQMAAFTNEFDVKGQNEAALKVFVRLDMANGEVKGKTNGGSKS